MLLQRNEILEVGHHTVMCYHSNLTDLVRREIGIIIGIAGSRNDYNTYNVFWRELMIKHYIALTF